MNYQFSYINHPNNVCMSYFTHMLFSLRMAKYMFIGTFQAIVHAFIPSMFLHGTTETTNTIQEALAESGCRKIRSINYRTIRFRSSRYA